MLFRLRRYQSYKKSSISSIILSMSRLTRRRIIHLCLDDLAWINLRLNICITSKCLTPTATVIKSITKDCIHQTGKTNATFPILLEKCNSSNVTQWLLASAAVWNKISANLSNLTQIESILCKAKQFTSLRIPFSKLPFGIGKPRMRKKLTHTS
jgi:hypothetical protein